MSKNDIQATALASLPRIGEYQRSMFTLVPSSKASRGIYVWVHDIAGALVPRRVGIACSEGGFGARFALYNRWLDGRFKPDNAREQEVRRLTIEGLGSGADVRAILLDDTSKALALEGQLRELWSDTLTLDLMNPGSWIKRRLQEWRSTRAAEAGAPRSFQKAASTQRGPDDAKSKATKGIVMGILGFPGLEERLDGADEWVRRVFHTLHSFILDLDDEIRVKEYARGEGLGYEVAGRTFCRIDPKQDYIGIGLINDARAAVSATNRLRPGRMDRAWFNHNRDDPLDETYRLIRAALRPA